jgi:hypothetical protein
MAANLPQDLQTVHRREVKVEKDGDQFAATTALLEIIPGGLAIPDDLDVGIEIRLAELAEEQLAVVLAVLHN